MTGAHSTADDPRVDAPARDSDPAIGRTTDDAPVAPLVAASWQQAEARLYPTVTERPDLYQRIILLVRRTVDRLREEGPATSALLAAADRGAELVADVAVASGLSTAELDLDLVARAALAMRYREVRGEQIIRRRLRLIAEARRAGQPWAVLEESGHFDGDPFLPYRRLEVEVATGRALLVSATPDEEFRQAQHTVAGLRVDLDSGAVLEAPAGSPVVTLPDAQSREEQARALKAAPR